jgi:hypothetical protein
MQTARRLYVYLLSAVSLGVLSTGIWLVLHVLLDTLGIGQGTPIGGSGTDREQLSLALALIGVGLPVWGVHWWLAERGLRLGATHGDEERGSTIRALYLSVVLAVTFALGAYASTQLIRELILAIFGGQTPNFFGSDVAGSLALLLVAAINWAYHVTVRRRDMSAGVLAGAAAWLPRLYLYGAALVALQLMLTGIAGLVEVTAQAILPRPDLIDDGSQVYVVADRASAVIVFGIAWLGHWWYAGRLTADPGWRGSSERAARLRLAYFVAAILISAAVVVERLAEASRAVLVPLFGATQSIGFGVTGSDLAREVAVSLVAAAVWTIAWWLHLRWMRGEALQQDDAGKSASAERLQVHAVAAVGLAFGAVGLAWLLGILVDVLLGGTRTAATNGLWRAELATFVPYAVIGSTVWLWKWSGAISRFATDATGEAGSIVRRTYLLIALAASVIASIGSLGLILYRLFGSLLGVSLRGNPVSELSTPIGILVMAVAVALYHGVAQRRDAALRAAQPQEGAAPQTAPAPAPPPAPATLEGRPAGRRLILSGPLDANLDQAISGLRATLPPGYRLEES